MDHRRMLAWANRNRNRLLADYMTFLRKHPYRVYAEEYMEPAQDVDRERYLVLRAGVAPLRWPVPDMALRVGDILHNMRVALDYLATAIARRHRPDLSESDDLMFKVAFPVCEHRSAWPSRLNRIRLEEWAGPTASKAIAALQPFERPFLANMDPLLLLHRLDNPHKHRNLLSAAPTITYIDFRAEAHEHFEVLRSGLEGAFEDGVAITRGRIRLEKPLDSESARSAFVRSIRAANVRVEFSPAFDDDGPAPHHPVFPLLREMATFIEFTAFPTLEPFV